MSCPEDCPAVCPDEACTHFESPSSCPGDCPTICGDLACTHDEDPVSCPRDCALDCGDGDCGDDETRASCPGDCPFESSLSWEARSFLDLALDPTATVVTEDDLDDRLAYGGYEDAELGFFFPFFDGFYNDVRIVVDGVLCFSGAGSDNVITEIPSTERPDNFIALFWETLNISDRWSGPSGRILYTRG